MNTGKAIAIFKDIESEDYSLGEKGAAVFAVMRMETKNSIAKADMEKVIKWFLTTFYEIEADAPEDLGHWDKYIITPDGTVTESTPKDLKEQLKEAEEALKPEKPIKDKEAEETLKPEEPIKSKVTKKPPYGAAACRSCKHLNKWKGDASCKECHAEYVFNIGNIASQWEPAVEIMEAEGDAPTIIEADRAESEGDNADRN